MQDIYLTGNPQVTFFKVVYRRHTNFAIESIQQTFNGNPGFGRRVTTQISRNGDLIHRIYLEVTLPSIANSSAWVEFPGLRLLADVELEIGGQRIDKHYADFMYVWNELSLPKGKRDGYNTMVGEPLAGTQNSGLLYIPLEFWFCRNVGLALPLIALQYHEVKINIDFETAANMLACGGSVADINGDLINTSLWVDYIFLDTDERRRFAQLSHEYLIEQLQFTGDEGINTSSAGIKLNFNHPTKELIWVVRKNTSTTHNHWTVYSDCSNVNNVATAKLQLNGQDRFYVRPGSYFNLVQPFQHHENVPCNTGINVYSFALKPEEHQPSGTLNFSRIDTAVMQLTLGSEAAAGSILKTYAINYNVLRIMSGINEFFNKKAEKLTCAKQSAAKQGYCDTFLGKQWKRNLVYNWLVDRNICNKTKLSGTPFRALTTTFIWKHMTGTRGNYLGYSNNVKDWVIRSQAPAVLRALDRVKVQRIDGFGGERNAILCDPLRYIPALCESIGIETGVVSLTATRVPKCYISKNKSMYFFNFVSVDESRFLACSIEYFPEIAEIAESDIRTTLLTYGCE